MTTDPEFYEWFMQRIPTLQENRQISIHMDVLMAKLDYNRTDFFVMLKEWREGYNVDRPKTFADAVDLFIEDINKKHDTVHSKDVFDQIITFRKKKPIEMTNPFTPESPFHAVWCDEVDK